MIILSCHSPVQGQLLLPFLLFIKSRQLSHNFTLRLMENLSVEFMVFFGQLLNWERSPAQSPECGKPFSQVLILSGLGQWMNVSAFDLPHQSGGTNESQGTFEHKLTWVIFTGKGLSLNEALLKSYRVKQSNFFFLKLPCKYCCTSKGHLWTCERGIKMVNRFDGSSLWDIGIQCQPY